MAYRGKHELHKKQYPTRKKAHRRRNRQGSVRPLVHLISVAGVLVFGFLLARYFWQDIRSDMLNEELGMAVELNTPAPAEQIPDISPVLPSAEPAPLVTPSPSPAIQPTPEPIPTPEPTPTPELAPIKVDFEKLSKENKDIIAWIFCQDTPINYAVVYRNDDNEYYLNHLLNGEYNEKGTIFVDKRNKTPFEEWNTILYGHNMKDGSMFGCIDEYGEQKFYEAHPVMYLITPEKDYKIEICSSFLTGLESTSFEFPRTQGNPLKTIDDITRYSYIETGIIPTEEDRLVSFSTCYESLQQRYVVIGILRELERLA